MDFYDSKKMSTIKGIWKYILIIMIGILLAVFVARIQYDSQDLAASVLSITEQEYFESTKWDAWYKKEDQNLEVFLAEQIRYMWPLSISILYNPSEIQPSIENIETNYSIINIQENEWNLIIEISWYENWDFIEWIFQLPYSGDSKDLTLEYIKSENLNFAIWNLDNIDSENQNHYN